MRLLIDANVLLDVLQSRNPQGQYSSVVWKLCETGLDEGYVSALSFANLVYIMRKELDPERIEEVFEMMEMIFRFADLSAGDLAKASAMKWNDFEDALQSAAAERLGADYIITGDVRDYSESRVEALTPVEYLAVRQMR